MPTKRVRQRLDRVAWTTHLAQTTMRRHSTTPPPECRKYFFSNYPEGKLILSQFNKWQLDVHHRAVCLSRVLRFTRIHSVKISDLHWSWNASLHRLRSSLCDHSSESVVNLCEDSDISRWPHCRLAIARLRHWRGINNAEGPNEYSAGNAIFATSNSQHYALTL